MLLAALSTVGCASAPITADPVYFPSPPARPRAVHLKSFNRLRELVPVHVGLIEAIRGGAVSPSIGRPAGIAYRGGVLYVCDTEYNVVHSWNLATGEAKRMGRSGEVVLVKPVAVAVDGSGTVYVADTGRGEVVAFDARGRALNLRFRPTNRERYTPVSLALSDSRLYVADIAAHRIDVFSTVDARVVDDFGNVGSQPGEFYYPMGVAVGPSGEILVSDMMNGRVQFLDASHKPILSMGQPGTRYGDMGKPRHLAVGPDGVIFIADVEFGHVHLFNDRGELLMLLGGPEDRPGSTPMPVGVAIAETLPLGVAALVPAGFRASYYLFVASTIGTKRIGLFAVGSAP
jgi:DNA-binding beta-propeller fold protein YncE